MNICRIPIGEEIVVLLQKGRDVNNIWLSVSIPNFANLNPKPLWDRTYVEMDYLN
jgi:hypothetical protein